MTHLPMAGVRVVEAAQFTYTPAAGAVLADWGADVIKIEHHVMGDAQRGMQAGPASFAVGSFKPIMEHPNRGKRSIGLALHEPAGLDVFYVFSATTSATVRERSARLYTGNYPLMMMSVAGKKGSMLFIEAGEARGYSDSAADIVNCALRPAVLRIETAGAGFYQGAT